MSRLTRVGIRMWPKRVAIASVLASASGLMTALPFLRPSLFPLIFISLVPWFYALKLSPSLKARLGQSALFSIFSTAVALNWLPHALTVTFQLAPMVSLIASLVGFVFCQPQVFAVALAANRLDVSQRPARPWWIETLCLCAVYVCADLISPKLFSDTLGFSLSDARHIKQIADLGGVHVLTFLIVFVNLCVFFALSEQKWKPVAVGIFCLVLTFGYGTWRIYELENEAVSSKLRLHVVQAHPDRSLKRAAFQNIEAAQVEIAEHGLTLTRDAIASDPAANAFVWGETAYPRPFGARASPTIKDVETQMRALARSSGRSFIFGAFKADDRAHRMYNSIISLQANGSEQIYRKNILLPFAEYIPLVGDFEIVKSKMSGKSWGANELRLLEIPTPVRVYRAFPVICFESLSMKHLARANALDADLILNLAEDTWFDSEQEALMHLRAASFASVVTHLPQVRATGAGVSALIDRTGQIVSQTAFDAQSSVGFDVPITKVSKGLYQPGSTLLFWFCLAGTICVFGAAIWDRSRGRR